MKHKPGWVTAKGSKACQPSAKKENCSLPQASLLTSAECGPALPVIFNLSILLQQQGNQLLHLALQHQVHLNQGPHEVTGHLQQRTGALGKVQVQEGTQLSTERSKQGTQQGPSKSWSPAQVTQGSTKYRTSLPHPVENGYKM